MRGVYRVRVDWTDRTLLAGAFKTWPCMVEVLADDEGDAVEAAVQLASALRHDRVGGMAVAAEILSAVL